MQRSCVGSRWFSVYYEDRILRVFGTLGMLVVTQKSVLQVPPALGILVVCNTKQRLTAMPSPASLVARMRFLLPSVLLEEQCVLQGELKEALCIACSSDAWMNKTLSIVTLIAIMISGLTLAGTVHLAIAQSSTPSTPSISPTQTPQNNTIGISQYHITNITSNTVWTKANSPYNFLGNVIVNSGATLTIEAGVTVNLHNSEYSIALLEIDGELRAIGTTSDPIRFYGDGYIIFRQESTSWNEQTSSGSIIQNAVINFTDPFPSGLRIEESASPKIDNSTIINQNPQGTGILIFGGKAIISNNFITATYTGIAASIDVIADSTCNASILNNTVSGCQRGIDLGYSGETKVGSSFVEGNLIINNEVGIERTAHSIIQNNAIAYNSVGIAVVREGSLVQNNSIANNSVGISDIYSLSTIIYNNIQNNSQSNIDQHSAPDVDATYNWWGTANVSAISQTIRDSTYYGSTTKFPVGTVNFVPFLTEPNPQAPTIPITTPTPAQSAQPTTVPTSIDGINPILGMIAAGIVAITVVGLAAYFYFRKHRKNGTAN